MALSLSLGRARLGESEYRCIQRYGDVQRKALRTIGGVDYNTLYFLRNGYIVAVIFSEGNAGVMVFVKADDSPMEDLDIQSLLATEGEKFTWTAASSQAGRRTWTRQDGAVAIYRDADHALMMGTRAFADMVLHPPPTNNNPATEGF